MSSRFVPECKDTGGCSYVHTYVVLKYTVSLHLHVNSVDAYIASIAIRIMSDTRDEEKDRNTKIKDQRCVARHPRSKK